MEGGGAYKITWSPGKPSLSITTDANLLPLIKATVTGDTLEIKSDQNLSPTKNITVVVSSTALAGVDLSGANHLTATKVSGEKLDLEASGACKLDVDGSITNLAVELSGACKVDAKSLNAHNVTLSISGASSADVTVSNTVNASISGASSITYAGNPKSVEKDVSGAASIRARD